MKIEEQIELKVENSNSRITFETVGSGSNETWDRYISLDNEKVLHIGNICGTCEFFFKKQSRSINVTLIQKQLIEALNSGDFKFTSEKVAELSKIIPNGNYLLLKAMIKPTVVTRDSANNYFKKEQRQTWHIDDQEETSSLSGNECHAYYREPMRDFGDMKYDHKHAFLNFFVPTYGSDKLNRKRVDFYKSELISGKTPLVVGIGVLDVKTSERHPFVEGEEIKPEFGTHWCLANYVVDGHHKIKAASELNREIGLVTFVSRDESWRMIDDMVCKLTGEKKKKQRFWKV